MRQIRSLTPRKDEDPNTAKGSEVWPGTLNGQPTQRVIIYLRSSGCFWAVGKPKHGAPVLLPGCLDCVHSVAGTTFGKPISAQSYVRQFLGEFGEYDFSKYTTLCLYNEGNFFHEAELPGEARREILRVIGRNPHIRSVILESLPEFITEENLREARELLGDRIIEIGIGLESSNPAVRALCVNKSYQLEDFERVVPLVKRYATLLAYVLLRPAFLGERAAIDDAIETSRYAFAKGTDIVSIEPLNLSDYNMSGVLNQFGLHRAPWLWSVFRVVKAVYAPARLRIGGDQFAPNYRHQAHNCERCTPEAKRLVNQFNETDDVQCLERLQCDCRIEWEEELNREEGTLLDRIESALDRLAKVGFPGMN